MGTRPLTPPTLTDGVVTLRLAHDGDAVRMTEGLSLEDTVRWLMSVPHPYAHEESLSWVATVAPGGWACGELLFLSIADAGSGEFLGEVGLTHVDLDAHRAEIAYWLMPDARGRGVMRRALTLLMRWGFDALDLERLDWGAIAGNEASLATARSVGFQFEGVRRGGFLRRYDGLRADEWIAGLLRSDVDP
jgi:RimJ/RimL family protein N-acetyltransferase